jgi:hypothetical protein
MNNSLLIVERITARMKTIYSAIQEVIDEMVSNSQTRMETDELVAKVASSLGMKANRIRQIVIDYLWQTETDKIGFVRKGAGGGYILGVRPAPKTVGKKTVAEDLTTTEDDGVAELVDEEEVEEIAI